MGSHRGSRQIRLGWKRRADAAPGRGSDLRPGHFPRAAQPELLQEPRDGITAREIQHLSWLQQHVANRQRKIPPGASRCREDVSSSRSGRAELGIARGRGSVPGGLGVQGRQAGSSRVWGALEPVPPGAVLAGQHPYPAQGAPKNLRWPQSPGEPLISSTGMWAKKTKLSLFSFPLGLVVPTPSKNVCALFSTLF